MIFIYLININKFDLYIISKDIFNNYFYYEWKVFWKKEEYILYCSITLNFEINILMALNYIFYIKLLFGMGQNQNGQVNPLLKDW